MIFGISLHLRMITQIAVSIFDLDLYFTVHRHCKFVCCDKAFGRILVLLGHISTYFSEANRHSGSVVEHSLCDREVAGSIAGWVIPKTLKMVLAALLFGGQL